MSFKIVKIQSSKQIKAFHSLPHHLYKHAEYWRPPFTFEVEKVFDPAKNERFQKGGECERFLVYESGRLTGRFALFTDPEKDKVYNPRLGGIGFLEFEDREGIIPEIIAFSKEWHRKRGNGGFRGPINFGENDMYWGILQQGFNDSNVYGMLYHHPYYKKHIEQTGAEKFDDLYMYQLRMQESVPERMIRIAERVKGKKEVSIRSIDPKNLQRDGEFIRQIYNAAFHNQVISEREEEFIGISRETIRQMIKKLRPVLMPETSPIVFVNGNPASFLVSVPDLHEISQKTGGRLKWWHLPRLIGFKKRARKFRPLAFGTKPEYRGRGLEALAFTEGKRLTREKYPNLEVLEGGFVSEKNWIMRRSLEALGCEIAKTYRVYKWLAG